MHTSMLTLCLFVRHLDNGLAVESQALHAHEDCAVQRDSMLFFNLNDSPIPADLPAALRLSRYELQIDLPIRIVNSSNRFKLNLLLNL